MPAHNIHNLLRLAPKESFSRRIKRWGFKRMCTTGQKQVIYSHPLFQKDNFALCQMMNARADRGDVKDEVVGKDKFQKAMAEQGALTDEPFKTQPGSDCAVPSNKQEKPQVQNMVMMPTMDTKKSFGPSLHVSPSLFSMPRQVLVMNYNHVPLLQNRLRIEQLTRLHQMEQMNQLGQPNRMEQMELMKQMQRQSSNRMEQINLMQQSNRMERIKLTEQSDRKKQMKLMERTDRMEEMKEMYMNPQGMGNNIHLTNPQGMGKKYMDHEVSMDSKVTNQKKTSKLDEDIAECDKQLLILERMKSLKEKRRSMGYE